MPREDARPGRELAVAGLLTLVGALVVLVATGRRWESPRGAIAGATTGAQIAPVAHALALVALAGVVALLAARGWTRVAVGCALALGGLAIVAVAASRAAQAWPALAILGGLCVAAAGVLTAARSRRWPALGGRYDAPAARRSEDDVWAALDRGEDPTAR